MSLSIYTLDKAISRPIVVSSIRHPFMILMGIATVLVNDLFINLLLCSNCFCSMIYCASTNIYDSIGWTTYEPPIATLNPIYFYLNSKCIRLHDHIRGKSTCTAFQIHDITNKESFDHNCLKFSIKKSSTDYSVSTI